MTRFAPRSFKIIIALGLFSFAVAVSAPIVLYYVPRAERAVEDDNRERMLQELSRVQSSLEYLLLKNDLEGARREVAILAFNHDTNLAALADDAGVIIASTQRAWLGRPIAEVVPGFDSGVAMQATRGRGARVDIGERRRMLRAYGAVRLAGGTRELRSSRMGSLFIEYDLQRAKARALNQIITQTTYWTAWIAALAFALWVAFHFFLTRRADHLVRVAERIAGGELDARSDLRGQDEIGRLGHAFDAMATEVALTQQRLHEDIAERIRTEAKLQASQASYRAIFDASEDAIFVFDIARATILDANIKACTTYGYTLAQMREVDISEVGSGSRIFSSQDLLKLIERAAAGERLHIEWKRRGLDGSPCWDEVFLKRVRIGDDDRILALTRDITEVKRTATELAQQREMLYQREKLSALGSLLAGVAHELNNPLSVVVARAVLLEEQGDERSRSAAVKIRIAAERCARIVRTFLAIARRQAPSRAPIPIDEVIAQALEITAYALRTAGVEVECDFGARGTQVMADGDQLHQVFTNLIVNAQQALEGAPAPRRIVISSRVDDDSKCMRVIVSDNGPGIPAKFRGRIFEPYFTTKPKGFGTGVGLSVSLGIVEAHGGTLSVDCPAEGGSRFSLTLPLEADSESIPARSERSDTLDCP